MKGSTKLGVVVSILVGLTLAIGLTSLKSARADETTFQWVIASADSALANDNSKITLTGTGTLQPNDPEEVTGGGTWQTFAPGATTPDASGTFQVTRLVKFDLAPGSVSDPSIHAGLAFLRTKYSDGSRGILVLSCHLPGTPLSVFEGATASKGFTDYWSRIPAPTFFRVVPESD